MCTDDLLANFSILCFEIQIRFEAHLFGKYLKEVPRNQFNYSIHMQFVSGTHMANDFGHLYIFYREQLLKRVSDIKCTKNCINAYTHPALHI